MPLTYNYIFELDDDVTRNPAAYEAAAEPKVLFAVPHSGHVGLYDQTELIPFEKLDEFFTENLAVLSNDRVGELLGSVS